MFGNRLLALLDARIHELFDLAAVKTDDVIVVLTFVQLEHRRRALEMVAGDQAGGLELRQDAIDRGEPDVFVRLEQMLVDVFRTHVARGGGPENFEDLDTRQA